MAIIKTTPTFNLLTSVEKMSDYEVYDSCIQEHFLPLLAEATDDDGMCLDKGPPGLGSTEPEPFFK